MKKLLVPIVGFLLLGIIVYGLYWSSSKIQKAQQKSAEIKAYKDALEREKSR